MPWDGDQFEYTTGYLDLVLSNFPCYLEAALRNPRCNEAMVVYDIHNAIENARLTRKELEVLMLWMEGVELMTIVCSLDSNAIFGFKGMKKIANKLLGVLKGEKDGE